MRASLATLVLLSFVAACGGGGDDASPASPTPSPCGTLPTAKPGAGTPSGFPQVAGQVVYDAYSLGPTTRIVLALVPDADFLKVRDGLVDRLKAGGFRITSTDQESVEAEAAFEGRLHGTIKVTPYCAGHVTVRYRFLG